MAATLLATGAFHEDGLADSIDGFGGGWTKEQVLTIMKDSRIGSYGAIGIGLALLAKFEALVGLPAVPQGDFLRGVSPAPSFLAALIAGHAASRFASTTLIYALDYARDDDSSKSKPLATRMGRGELAVAGFFGLAPCLLLPADSSVASPCRWSPPSRCWRRATSPGASAATRATASVRRSSSRSWRSISAWPPRSRMKLPPD